MMNKLAAKVAVKMMGLKKDEKGQGLAEYALTLIAVVAVVAAATLILQGKITDLFNSIKWS